MVPNPTWEKNAATLKHGAGVESQRQVWLVPTQPLCLSIDPGYFRGHLHFDPLFVLNVPSRMQEFPLVILDYLPVWREVEHRSRFLIAMPGSLLPPEEQVGCWLTWMSFESPLRISPELPYALPEGSGISDIRGYTAGGNPYLVGGPMPPMPAYGPLGPWLRMIERGL